MKRLLYAAAVSAAAVAPSGAAVAADIKNVIIMIADGAGFNMVDAARLYGGPLTVDRPTFQNIAVSTYPLRTSGVPIPGPAGLVQNPNSVYDPARNWDTTPVAGNTGAYPRSFQGYEWNRANAPDSANTIVGLVTGQKTYNNAVNVDGSGNALLTLAEVAHGTGRATGVVSTVQFSDATPSVGGGAHNVARSNTQAIANEMFGAGVLDVIAGAGNPDYDNNGMMRATPQYGWISPALWNDLKNGTNLSGANGQNWTLLQNREQIQAIANSSASAPEKLAMISRAYEGTQQYSGTGLAAGTEDPYASPLVDAQPTLSEITLAALNRLGRDPEGLYLLSEGGGVDRAMHSNNLGRAIEAYLEFDKAVSDVIDWVNRADTGASWDDTLLLVSADHDHLLFGPDGATNPFQPVLADGPDAGQLPEHRWLGNGHSNQLVPLFAMGKGANEVAGLASKLDFYTDAQGRTFGRGAYTDQTDIGRYLLSAVNASAVPEPATWAAMVLGFAFVGGSVRTRRAPPRKLAA